MMIPICNEGLASQQRPNGCGKAAGGRPQSRISPMELSKPKSGKEHAGEDSNLPSITDVVEMKVEEVDRRTICSGAPASVTNEVVVWSVHRLSVWHFVTPPSTPRIT